MPANLTMFSVWYLHTVPLHGQGIKQQGAPRYNITSSGDQFNGFNSLHTADNTGQWPHYPIIAAVLIQFYSRLMETLITGTVLTLRNKHRDLAFPADSRT